MKLIADTHTHTLASTHAYSTVLENAKFASEAGLAYLGITDHAPSMTDAPHWWHFENLRVLPDELYGVKLLKGIEADLCGCLLYTSPSPRDRQKSRMPSSA